MSESLSKSALPQAREQTPRGRITRRRVLGGAAGLVGLSAAATAGYATGIEPQGLVVTRYVPNPPGWSARRKLSVTVIADIHAGGPDMTLLHIRRVVDTANALKSDLIVLLGDYTATYRFATRIPNATWAAELARLTAPLGTWSILGNHDWWHDVDDIRRALTAVHIPILENDAVMLGAEGQRFWLAGLGDQIAYRLGQGRFRGVDDLPGTLAQVRTDDPVLLLAHEPDIFPRVPSRVALTLSGHTHGGQIRLPLIWPAFVSVAIRRAFRLRPRGRKRSSPDRVRRPRHQLFPARLGVPPEIVHIVLGA
jgi:uncharacterized protein